MFFIIIKFIIINMYLIGEFCLRENEDGVDINRNYDAHWEYNDDDI